MISYVIQACIANRFLVFLATFFLSLWGIWAVYNTPVDALPDLSDIQVIIQTPYSGQAPQLVENMVTYPLTTTMLSVPGAKTVRGFSSFGTSFVYVIFEEGTDLYWARSRVLEYLNQAQSKLPSGVTSSIGPDATGVGWIYEYALVDRTGKHDISELRSLQDWLFKFELATVPDVAEVASVGGVVKEYQIVVDPIKLDQYNITLQQVTSAIKNSNQEAGGSVIEQAEAEYMVRASGYLESLEDFRNIAVKTSEDGTPIYLNDISQINIGPEMRRGVAELNGQGEVAGGIVLLRSGKNAHEVIKNVRKKLEQLKSSLPEGIEIVSTYDRSQIIDRAIHNLSSKLIEEFIVVAIVCALFLMHVRSALVAIMSLPLGLFFAFIIMYYQGVTANIMSLGGIAIAVGAMVDAAVVMIENTHKKIELWSKKNPSQELSNKQRWELVSVASAEVAPALFISLLIITLSFIPVFSLEGQEGKLFGPLAFTKTYSMAGAAFLAVLVIPVLMGVWIRGKIPEENKNPINRFLLSAYHPAITWVLKHPKRVLLGALMILLTCIWPLSHLGGEFLPRIDEGDLLYMPSTLPGVSSSEATRILQTTDKLIKTVPEVKQVFGKVGRAETATDSAPMAMLESTIQLKPKEEWRPGMTTDKIIEELDRVVRLPGVANLWVPPIRNRIDMISTGVKSPIGIKVSGTDMHVIDNTAEAVQEASKKVSGVVSALAEKLIGGRYVDVKINRQLTARYGLNIADVQTYITSAVGGEMLTDTVEGIARYPINVRYPQEYRDSIYSLQNLPIRTPEGKSLVLSDVADVTTAMGPMMIKSENARPAAWVFIDARDRDMLSVVHDLQEVIQNNVKLPSGVSISYTGQFELMERANAKLTLMIPTTLLIIFVLLYLEFRNIKEVLLIMFSLPFALVGGIWFMYIKGYAMSVATGIGFIALAGLAAEFGVIMLMYLRHALQARPELKDLLNKSFDKQGKRNIPHYVDFKKVEQAAEIAIYEGAALRVRPKAMTVATIIAGLLPIFWSDGTGSEVMTRVAAPMIGGMISASMLSMFIIPAAYKLITIHTIKSKNKR